MSKFTTYYYYVVVVVGRQWHINGALRSLLRKNLILGNQRFFSKGGRKKSGFEFLFFISPQFSHLLTKRSYYYLHYSSASVLELSDRLDREMGWDGRSNIASHE